MSENEALRKAKIARIKRYKQLRRIRNYKNKTRVNLAAARFLTYASLPAFSAFPVNTADAVVPPVVASSSSLENRMPFLTEDLASFDVSGTIRDIAAKEKEHFVNTLDRQLNDILAHADDSARKKYVQRLFGNINYCNLAVYRALKLSASDYMHPYLDDIQNPAACQNFIDYIQKTHPDCISFEKNINPLKIERGDIVVLKVSRRDENARTVSGNHTVTFDGRRAISFNRDKRYNIGGASGYVIKTQKICEKELTKKVEGMSKIEALFYLKQLASHDNAVRMQYYTEAKTAPETLFLQNLSPTHHPTTR